MNRKNLQVTLIGDGNADEIKSQEAFKIGQFLADHHAVVITGGRGGVMEAVSKGAKSKGGTVVGILPGAQKSEANEYCDIIIPTGMGHTRNSLTILAADVVISIGGGAGTLSELAFSWIYDKPVLALDYLDGWSERLAGRALDQKKKGTIHRISDFDQLKNKFLELLSQ